MNAALSRLGRLDAFLLFVSSMCLDGEMGTIFERPLNDPSIGDLSGVEVSEAMLHKKLVLLLLNRI